MYTDSKQLITSNDDYDVEMKNFLYDTLQSYIDLRDLPYPYYNWISITQKWNEYERCYEVRAKSDRQEYEYQGFSNIVLPDFHEKVETVRTRDMNIFFSGAEMFDTKENKYSKADDAHLAKKLVQYNFDVIEDFRLETSMVDKDKDIYGTWFAYTPFTIEEKKEKQVLDYLLDDKGLPVTVNGIPQKKEPYEAYIVHEIKFTDVQHLNVKHVYLHPKIDDIQRQESVFVLMFKNYNDLLQMEKDEVIGKGMANWVKDNYSNISSGDGDLQQGEDARVGFNQEEVKERKLMVYDVYLVWFWYGDGKERKRYEGIMLQQGKLIGLREYTQEEIPLMQGWHIKTQGAYGMGMGDEMYPVYTAKCARLNQVMDISSFEIKGGGFKDSQMLSKFTGLKPGVWQDVSGLAAQLSSEARPILSWNDIRGNTRSAISGMDITGVFNEAMQAGTGAVSLLAGMPTQSEIDKTVGGIKASISESNIRINSYVEDFENQYFKKLANICYANYQEYLIPKEDVPRILDSEDFTYIDANGQPQEIVIKDTLPGVEFTFQAVKRIVESEKQLGKYQRFLMTIAQLVQSVAPIMPEFAEMVVKGIDYKFIIDELARNMEIADIDKIFPRQNLMGELMETRTQVKVLDQENQAMVQGIEAAMAKFQETGNQSAVQTTQEIMQQVMAQAQGQEQGVQGEPQR